MASPPRPPHLRHVRPTRTPTQTMGPRPGTHTPKGSRLVRELLADAQRWATTITPAEVLSQIGSPFAADPQPVVSEELDPAA